MVPYKTRRPVPQGSSSAYIYLLTYVRTGDIQIPRWTHLIIGEPGDVNSVPHLDLGGWPRLNGPNLELQIYQLEGELSGQNKTLGYVTYLGTYLPGRPMYVLQASWKLSQVHHRHHHLSPMITWERAASDFRKMASKGKEAAVAGGYDMISLARKMITI